MNNSTSLIANDATYFDFVTVLTGTGRGLAAKIIRPNGKPVAAEWDKYFRVETVEVNGLSDLHDLMKRVTLNPKSLLIRDKLKGHASNPVRRNVDTFEPADHHWIMLDFDGIEAPQGVSPIDLHTVDDLVKAQLPPEFHEADYVAHFSSTAGTPFAGQKIKVHLFFWLAKPAASHALKPWVASVGADPALFNPVQAHFVADPKFENCTDPLNGIRLFHVEKGQPVVDFVPPTVAAYPALVRHKGNGGGASGITLDAVTGLITDGREGWLLSRIYQILQRRVTGGESLAFPDVEVEVWMDFQAACDRTGWSRAAVAGKVHGSLDRHERGQIPALKRVSRGGMVPHYNPVMQPIADIQVELAKIGNDFFTSAAPDDVVVLAAPPGAGKSFMAMSELRKLNGRTADYYLPTLKLAEQFADALGPELGRVIRGRNQPDPNQPGFEMCHRSATADKVSKAGLSVTATLCRGCPQKSSCGYLAQWRDPPPVLFMAHNYLALPRPAAVPRADFVVIDESFLSITLVRGSFPLSDLTKLPGGLLPKAIREGLQRGRLLGALHDAGITPGQIWAAQRGLWSGRKPKITGNMADTMIAALLANHKPVSRLAGFLGWLANEFVEMKPADAATEQAAHAVTALWLCMFSLARDTRQRLAAMSWGPDTLNDLFRALPLQREISHIAWLHGEVVEVSYPRKLRRLEGQPILHLDGTADQSIVELALGPCAFFKRWDAERFASIIQVTSRPYGKTGLLSDRERLASYQRFAARLAGKTFLCAQKEVRAVLANEDATASLPAPSDFHPDGLDVFHFGQTQGLNGFKDHDNAVIIGRTQPPPHAVEGYRGMFWKDPLPLNLPGEFVHSDRGYAGASGQGVSVQVHPETRLQPFLEHVREAGVVQALDRLRAIQPADRPRAMVLLGNLPLRILPTILVEEADLVPEWWDLAELGGGVLPDSPTALTNLLPNRFGSVQTAKDWLRNGGASVPWVGGPGWGQVWQKVELMNKSLYTSTPPFAKFTVKSPLGSVRYRAWPLRSDRPPKVQRAITLTDPLSTFRKLRNQMDQRIEVIMQMPGFSVFVRDANPDEAKWAKHAAERLAVYESDPAAAHLRQEAVIAEFLAGTRPNDASLLMALLAIAMADAKRCLFQLSEAERVALLQDLEVWSTAVCRLTEQLNAGTAVGGMGAAELDRLTTEAAARFSELFEIFPRFKST